MKQWRRGITMAETVLSTIVVSVLLSAALTAAVSSRSLFASAGERALALQLADELMGEVLQQSYVDPETPGAAAGPDAGELARADFDDIDDYSDFKSCPPTARDGLAIEGAEHLTQAVTLLAETQSDFAPDASVWKTFTVIRVEIYRDDRLLCRLEGLRTDARAGVGQ